MSVNNSAGLEKSGIEVVNSGFHNTCTFCRSERIFALGKITYPEPTLFADTPINLINQPELWECGDCLSRFVQHPVPEKEGTIFYSVKTSQRWTSPLPFTQRRTDSLVKLVNKHIRPGHHVLDIGCSTGAFLSFVKEKGCMTYGIESSAAARAEASAAGHDCRASMDDFDKGVLFDAVFCFDVIEHVYSVKDFLDRFTSVLKPGGILFILTGDVRCWLSRKLGSRWWYVLYPEHISFPSYEFLNSLKQFSIIDTCRTFAFRHQEGHISRKIKDIVVKGIQKKYIGYASPFPDHLTVVLRKTEHPG